MTTGMPAADLVLKNANVITVDPGHANAELVAGLTDRLMSRLDEAATRLEAAEVAYRRLGQPSGLGWVLSVSGQVSRYRGDFEAEIQKQREAREVFEGQGAPFQIAFTLVNECISLTLLGRAGDAIEPSRRAIAMERDMTLNDFAVETMSLAGWFEQEAGNLVEALDLFGGKARPDAPRCSYAPAPGFARKGDSLVVIEHGRHFEALA